MPKVNKQTKSNAKKIVKVPMYARTRNFFYEFKLFDEDWPTFFERVVQKSFPKGNREK